MRKHHVRQRVGLTLGVLLLAGCATYVPAAVEDLPVGGRVRVLLSRQAFANLPQISDRMGARLEGTLVRRTSTEVVLHVPISIGSAFGQDINVPHAGIVQSEIRQLSRAKTALAAVVGLAAVVSVVVGSTSDQPQTGIQDQPRPDEGNEGFAGRVARASPFVRVLSFTIPLW